uniref:Uncharacterized protein n=2 Tax=Picea TaxID=3328 RepID=A0A101LTV0_PICGL|nr:hypothetical protein ABT39_MTgene3562 [Picea glauca]QHR89846.1 hypothetical protein Q903MT_gene3868 [Picea sitchensis]
MKTLIPIPMTPPLLILLPIPIPRTMSDSSHNNNITQHYAPGGVKSNC